MDLDARRSVFAIQLFVDGHEDYVGLFSVGGGSSGFISPLAAISTSLL